MKQLIRFSLILSIFWGNSAFSLSPIQGIYVGILGEVSHNSNSTFNATIDQVPYVATLSYNTAGAGGGGVVGYRIQKFRVEGELLYNWVSYDSLSIGNCTLLSPSLPTPTGRCPNNALQNLGFNGSSSILYGLINGYFDFVTYDTDTQVVPYIGLGLGMAKVRVGPSFTNTVTQFSAGGNFSSSSAAAQGIIGLSYFLDDFTWVAFDYRYLTTNTVQEFGNNRFAINTLNFSANFSFDNGK